MTGCLFGEVIALCFSYWELGGNKNVYWLRVPEDRNGKYCHKVLIACYFPAAVVT